MRTRYHHYNMYNRIYQKGLNQAVMIERNLFQNGANVVAAI